MSHVLKAVQSVSNRLANLFSRNSALVVNKNIRVEAIGDLKTLEDHLHLFIQNVKDYAIFVLDPNGKVASWNQGAEKIKQYKSSEIIGKHFSVFYPDKTKAVTFTTHELEIAKKMGRFEDEGLRLRKDGSQFWAHVIITAVFNSENTLTGFIKVTRDITEKKQAEKALKKAYESLELRVQERTHELQQREVELNEAKNLAEAANDAKSAFLANMSHEIRTPLGAILGFSELLVNNEINDAEKSEIITAIKRNGSLLTNLVNDILDLSKVEAGKLLIEKSPTLLKEILQDLRSTMTLEASGKGIDLKIIEKGTLPHSINTDPLRIRQILLNIVGNAIKFTTKGSVTVSVEAQGDKVLFTVRDTGKGISEEHAQKLFEPFNQGDSTITRKYGGTGLGLALSKRLSILLGGDLVLTSSHLGEGSVFTITVDIGQELLSSTPPTRKRPTNTLGLPDHEALQNKAILIVDDSLDNQALVKLYLKNHKVQTSFACNGKEALSICASFNPDLILMDLQMPEMGGVEATAALRDKGYKGPIIALSAHAMHEEKAHCLNNGFNAYLTKPIDRKVMLETLAKFISPTV